MYNFICGAAIRGGLSASRAKTSSQPFPITGTRLRARIGAPERGAARGSFKTGRGNN